MTLKLIIANKVYSTWSFRPWIMMVHAQISFEEKLIPYDDWDKVQIRKFSPTGRVPVLHTGKQIVWDSLAILEYLAEQFRDKKLWPSDDKARAHARSISAEMHSGFQALRSGPCNMNFRRLNQPRASPLPPAVKQDIARIEEIWTQTRENYGADGPFLFGERFTIADAMYAPVVSRFRTYALSQNEIAHDYIEAVSSLPAFKRWEAEALAEPWHVPETDNLD